MMKRQSSRRTAKELSQIKFRIVISAEGREPSGSLTPDGLRRSAKVGIYFRTVSKVRQNAK